jgi:hypothetical protein
VWEGIPGIQNPILSDYHAQDIIPQVFGRIPYPKYLKEDGQNSQMDRVAIRFVCGSGCVCVLTVRPHPPQPPIISNSHSWELGLVTRMLRDWAILSESRSAARRSLAASLSRACSRLYSAKCANSRTQRP